MSPSRGSKGTRGSLLLAIATVTVLHLIVWCSTRSLRLRHLAAAAPPQLSKRSGHEGQHVDLETDALIDWWSIYRDASRHQRPVVFGAMTLWLTFLFAFVGICASEFFCPNLSHIASRLGLSESVAGVTFLAFSNGSPDVFSTFSALKSNAGSLAIGELIGAASFIVSVVAGTMALITPFRVSRHTFLRDVGFFTLAVLLTLGILYDSHIHLWEALVMVALYVCYVCYVALGGWYHARRQARKRRLRDARDEYDHGVGTAGDREEQGRGRTALLSIDDDDDDDDEGGGGIAHGAEIEWELPRSDDDDDDVIHLPVSGTTTPRSVRSLAPPTPPPIILSPRLPRAHSHSHSHYRSRSTSLINPSTFSAAFAATANGSSSATVSAGGGGGANSSGWQRPPPTPLSLQNSVSSLSANSDHLVGATSGASDAVFVTTTTSTASGRKIARPSLLGAIEFRDFVNSLQHEQNASSSIFDHDHAKRSPSLSSSKRRKGKSKTNQRQHGGKTTSRPTMHSRTTTSSSTLSGHHEDNDGAAAGQGVRGAWPASEGEEWSWNGWGGSSEHFGGGAAGRRRASSSPGFRPRLFGGSNDGGKLRLGGDDDTLANGVLQGRTTTGQSVYSETSSSDEGGGRDDEEENPWRQEPTAAAAGGQRGVKKVPSILLTLENGEADTLLPAAVALGDEPHPVSTSKTNAPPSSSVSSKSSLTVRATTTPSQEATTPFAVDASVPATSIESGQPSAGRRHDLRVAKVARFNQRTILLRAIVRSLFPSLDRFGQKSLIGKLTAVMCVPALFVLNLTLPVAEEVQEGDLVVDEMFGCDWHDPFAAAAELEGSIQSRDGVEKAPGGEARGIPRGIRLPEGDSENDGTLLSTPSFEDSEHGGDHGESSERVGKRLHSPAIAHPHSHHLSNLQEHDATAIDLDSPWVDQASSNAAAVSHHHFRFASQGSDGTVNHVSSSSMDTRLDEVDEDDDGGDDSDTDSLILDRLECDAARKVTRGLTAVQCTLGPVFCAFALFADELKWYQPVVALAVGLFFATLAYRFFHNPRHPGRVSLCFVGFGIAMVWILMIVNEVVGVLQTLGHIFGISDAILGLTIFAMGNSLGDLVANATVARMGYPSMAIAACFGGPMLNILLGVGLSGTYLIASNPTREPIHVEMGPTLMVSGVGLFTILIGSLIVVPLNGFRMTKRIGGFLIAAYTVVLSINVVTEIWW